MYYALFQLLKPLYFSFNCMQPHKAPFHLLFLFTFPSSFCLPTTAVVLCQAQVSLKTITTKEDEFC